MIYDINKNGVFNSDTPFLFILIMIPLNKSHSPVIASPA